MCVDGLKKKEEETEAERRSTEGVWLTGWVGGGRPECFSSLRHGEEESSVFTTGPSVSLYCLCAR